MVTLYQIAATLGISYIKVVAARQHLGLIPASRGGPKNRTMYFDESVIETFRKHFKIPADASPVPSQPSHQ